VVEILVPTDDEVGDLRVRQLAAVRSFLQVVVENRTAAGVSRLAGSVDRTEVTRRAEGGTR
jgi:hypothetical protein